MSYSTKRRVGVGGCVLLVGALCWSVVVACSTDEEHTTFTVDDAGDSATTPPPAFDGTFAPEDAAGCAPVAPARPLSTAPPTHFQPGVCTSAQVDGYVKDCLDSDGNVCKAYKNANAACAACVETVSADSSWGAIVFYGSRQYFDYNYGGCIANVTGDFAPTGCGAAETRYLECRHEACAPCLPPGLPRDYAPFYACQAKKATDMLCAAELTEVNTACATYFAGQPKDACQAAGLPSHDYLRQLLTGWCGGAAPDAGDDAGDGG
jgi:hypothetical protein